MKHELVDCDSFQFILCIPTVFSYFLLLNYIIREVLARILLLDKCYESYLTRKLSKISAIISFFGVIFIIKRYS